MRFFDPEYGVYKPVQDNAPMDMNLLMAAIKGREEKLDAADKLAAEIADKKTVKGGYSTDEKAKAYQKNIDKLWDESRVDLQAGDTRTAAQKIYKIKNMINSDEALGYAMDFKESQQLAQDLQKEGLDPNAAIFNSDVKAGDKWNQISGSEFKPGRYNYTTKNYNRDFKDYYSQARANTDKYLASGDGVKKLGNGQYEITDAATGNTTVRLDNEIFRDRLIGIVRTAGNDLEDLKSIPTVRGELMSNEDFKLAQQMLKDEIAQYGEPQLNADGLNVLQETLLDKLVENSSPYQYNNTATTNNTDITLRNQGKGAGSSSGASSKSLGLPTVEINSQAVKKGRDVGETDGNFEKNKENNSAKIKAIVSENNNFINNPQAFYNGLKKSDTNLPDLTVDNTAFKKVIENDLAGKGTVGLDGVFKSGSDYLPEEQVSGIYNKMKASYIASKNKVDAMVKVNHDFIDNIASNPEIKHLNLKKEDFELDPESNMYKYKSGFEEKAKSEALKAAEVQLQLSRLSPFTGKANEFFTWGINKILPSLSNLTGPTGTVLSTIKNLVSSKVTLKDDQLVKEFEKLAELPVDPKLITTKTGEQLQVLKEVGDTYVKTYKSELAKDPNYGKIEKALNNTYETNFGLISPSYNVVSLQAYTNTEPGKDFAGSINNIVETSLTDLANTRGAFTQSGLLVTDPKIFGENNDGLLSKNRVVKVGGTTVDENNTPLLQVTIEPTKDNQDGVVQTVYIPLEKWAGHPEFKDLIETTHLGSDIGNSVETNINLQRKANPNIKEYDITTPYNLSTFDENGEFLKDNVTINVKKNIDGTYKYKFPDNLQIYDPADGTYHPVDKSDVQWKTVKDQNVLAATLNNLKNKIPMVMQDNTIPAQDSVVDYSELLDDNYTLGDFISKEEASGPETISSGSGDRGGVSYGKYQFPSVKGDNGLSQVENFISNSPYAEEFKGMRVNSPVFKRTWEKIARENPEEFKRAQFEYNFSNNISPVFNDYENLGGDINSKTIQETLYGIATQFGPAGAKNVIQKALGNDLSDYTEEEIITKLHDYISSHTDSLFRSSSPNVRESVKNRYAKTKSELLTLLDQEKNANI